MFSPCWHINFLQNKVGLLRRDHLNLDRRAGILPYLKMSCSSSSVRFWSSRFCFCISSCSFGVRELRPSKSHFSRKAFFWWGRIQTSKSTLKVRLVSHLLYLSWCHRHDPHSYPVSSIRQPDSGECHWKRNTKKHLCFEIDLKPNSLRTMSLFISPPNKYIEDVSWYL